jgi:SlyX protein
MADGLDATLQALAARIDTLEMRVAYQDEVIEELNTVVVEQWARLDLAQRRMEALQERLRDIQERAAPDQRDEPPPPHY